MTVCIAAICQAPAGPWIVGASDRMVTAGDIQFEPPQSKIYRLAPRIVALIAGDSDAQTEILHQVLYHEPRSIQEAVHVYCRQLGNYNQRQAERKNLFPLGLSMSAFLRKQQHMSPATVDQIMDDIWRERVSVQTIICGLDRLGAHIYTIDDNGRAYCNDGIGFAAIGDGIWHASSQYMFARYLPSWDVPGALLLAYIAKRRAEVATGVGQESDLFYIANDLAFVQGELLGKLEQTYRQMQTSQERAIQEASERIQGFFERMVQRPPNPAETDESPSLTHQPNQQDAKPSDGS